MASRAASFASPIFCRTAPFALSTLPSACKRLLPVRPPTASFTAPFVLSTAPLACSLSIMFSCYAGQRTLGALVHADVASTPSSIPCLTYRPLLSSQTLPLTRMRCSAVPWMAGSSSDRCVHCSWAHPHGSVEHPELSFGDQL